MRAAVAVRGPGVPAARAREVAAWRRIAPGLLLAGAVGLCAHLVAKLAFPHGFALGFEVPLAMMLGLLVVNLGGAEAWSAAGVQFAIKRVLALGIVLLGLRLNLQAIAVIGVEAMALVAFTIVGACAFAIVVGRHLGVQRRLTVLIGVGTSVCGNSAILAAAPALRAGDREVGFAVATITIFGTMAVFVFPLVGHALDLDVLAYGLWSGAAVPDTAQTIASSAAYSTVGRDVAIVVKLVRNVLMAPLVLLIAWGWSRWGEDGGVSAASARAGVRRAFPWFLLGFLALALARSARVVSPETVADADVLTRACFVVALAGFGLQTRLSHLRALGARPFMLGMGTSTVLACGSLALILALQLGPPRTAVTGAVDPRPLGAWTAVCGGAAPRCSLGSLGEAAAGGGATSPSPEPTVRLRGRVLATGVPGAGALSPVGRFHAGGPMHDNRAFAATTRPGQVLDPDRLLVASDSNFGAPSARGDWAPGSIVSLATDARRPLRVPATFARNGGQASASGGDVRLYTAQAPAFLNAVHNDGAATADMPAVSNPLGISINNAFGRPWLANAPGGAGVETVLDPDGRPLADAPSDRAGGVFAGALTDREAQRHRGSLRAGAVGNALLGASPDTTGRAVFAVATADGALVQVHVEKGVDGLAPPATIAPLPRAAGTRAIRVGMAFNWVPDRFLYVTDPGHDAVVQVHLGDDLDTFHVKGIRRLQSPAFDDPVDLAPAVPEIASPAFSSNTTLAGGSDLYVANRGSGTIVRMRQDGRIRAIAGLEVAGEPIGGGRLNGIAVSQDAERIWVSLSGGRDAGGSVAELPAFGSPR